MKKRYLIVLICICSLNSISTTEGTKTTIEPTPIILDVDVDTSDTNALLYLVNEPLVSIKAITVSCGVSYIDEGVENVLKLLEYLDIENIPVAGGSSTPLVVNHSFPVEWREASKNFYGVSLPPTTYQPADMNASELILATLNEAETPMNILALGPLTNIAHAIQKDPTITQKIARIDIMGGAVNVAGNIGNVYPTIPNYVAEWNFYVDPQAVEIVFSAIDDIRLVPLDATNDVPVTAAFKTKLAQEKITKEANISYQLLNEWLYFWDELTAVAFTHPEVVAFEMNHIDIIVDQINQEGQTVKNTSAPANVEVAIGADKVVFEELFLKTINHEVETITITTTTSEVARIHTTASIVVSMIILVKLKEKEKKGRLSDFVYESRTGQEKEKGGEK